MILDGLLLPDTDTPAGRYLDAAAPHAPFPAQLVHAFTPLGAIGAIVTATFLSAQAIWGDDHAAAAYWSLGIGAAVSAAVVAYGLSTLNRAAERLAAIDRARTLHPSNLAAIPADQDPDGWVPAS